MKKFFFTILIAFTSLSLQAQVNVIEQPISHYILEDFTIGLIYMKDGVISRGALNYNSVTEEMLFKDKGRILAIGKSEVDLVDTVVVGGKIFYPYNGKFLEIAYKKDGVELQVEHKCRVIEPPKPSAFGTTTETANSKSYTNLTANGMFYSLKLPEGFRVVPFKYYWFRDGDSMTKVINTRQLAKYFSKDKAKYDRYMKENKVSFNKAEDITALVKYMLE